MDFMEDVDLEIKKDDWHEHWKMQIHLKNFLSDRSLSAVRKLLKIIRGSDTPDEETKIKDYVQEYLNNADAELLEWERKKIGYEQKVNFSESRLTDMRKTRDKFKRNSAPYKEWSASIKQADVDLKQFRSRLSTARQTIDDILKNVMFCQKVIKLLG